VGVVGYNLRDLGTRQAPVALGYGVSVAPQPELTFVLDAVHDFTTADPGRGVETSVGGGAEIVLKGFLVARAGGGRDGATKAGYASAGIATISGLGAVDAGLRQDLTGDRKLTYLVVGLRLFIEAPPPPGQSRGSSQGQSVALPPDVPLDRSPNQPAPSPEKQVTGPAGSSDIH
jgi:hypothetical protein